MFPYTGTCCQDAVNGIENVIRALVLRGLKHGSRISKVRGMRYKPYLSVTHTHTLTHKLYLTLLFFMELNAVYLAVIAALRGHTAASIGGHSCAEDSSLVPVFFWEPVLPICLISKRHANLRSLQRTASESQVRRGYQTSQWARYKKKKRQQKQSVGPGLSF